MDNTLHLTGLLLCSLAAGPAAAQQRQYPANRPNVIYIYADDMGKGMISAYGQKHFTTPHLDALIERGCSFSNAHGCMLSAPARASLLTGYHDCHGEEKWRISPGGRYIPATDSLPLLEKAEEYIDSHDVVLPEGDLYLAEVFRKAGYVTAQIGKLEWGFTATRRQMARHGWDYYYGYLDHVRCHGYYPPFLFDNGEVVKIPGNTHRNCGKSLENETEEKRRERWDKSGKTVYSQDIFLEKILAFIRGHRDRPFFLFHPTQLPHGPVSVPAIHPELMDNDSLTCLEKEYATMVKILDDNVGAIMEELDKLGLARNTIVIFAADNGHEIYYSEKGRCEKPYRNMETGRHFDNLTDKYYSRAAGDRFNGNAGMAGMKRSNLEGGVHIPLVFHCPGLIPEGTVRDEVVSNYDFLPTVADWLDISLTTPKDGISFLKLLQGKKGLPKDRHIVFGSNEGPAIVSQDGWKLRTFLKHNAFELYNLKKDPQERQNLASRYPGKVEELKKLLLEACGGNLKNGINRAG